MMIELQRIRLRSDLPVALRAYRTSPAEGAEIRRQISKLLQAKIIRESSSPYSSPATLVLKSDEGKKKNVYRLQRI